MTTRQEVVAFAAHENGYKEGRNNDTKYGVWFGLNHAAWCAMFVSYCYAHAGLPLPAIQTPKGFASVALGEQWFKKMKLWRVNPSKGLPGDIVIYKFSHTGILAGYEGNKALVWEGNTDGAGSRTGGRVMLQRRPLTIIKGLGTPQGFTTPPAPKPAAPALPNFSQWPGRYLSLATPLMTGKDVKLLQMRFQQLGAKIEADGVFGQATYDLVKWWQGALQIHPADGVVGPQTWTRLFK